MGRDYEGRTTCADSLMTESKLRAKIAYAEILRGKHLRLACFFRTKLAEYQEDLNRMKETLSLMDQA